MASSAADTTDDATRDTLVAISKLCTKYEKKAFYHGKVNDFDFDGFPRACRVNQRIFYLKKNPGPNPEWDFGFGTLKPHAKHICGNAAYLGKWNSFNFRCHGHLDAKFVKELQDLIRSSSTGEQRAKAPALSRIVEELEIAQRNIHYHGMYRNASTGGADVIADNHYFEIKKGFHVPHPEWQFATGGKKLKPDHVCCNYTIFKNGYQCHGHIPLSVSEEISSICDTVLHPKKNSANDSASNVSGSLDLDDFSSESLLNLMEASQAKTDNACTIRHSALGGGNVPIYAAPSGCHPLPVYAFDKDVKRSVSFQVSLDRPVILRKFCLDMAFDIELGPWVEYEISLSYTPCITSYAGTSNVVKKLLDRFPLNVVMEPGMQDEFQHYTCPLVLDISTKLLKFTLTYTYPAPNPLRRLTFTAFGDKFTGRASAALQKTSMRDSMIFHSPNHKRLVEAACDSSKSLTDRKAALRLLVFGVRRSRSSNDEQRKTKVYASVTDCLDLKAFIHAMFVDSYPSAGDTFDIVAFHKNDDPGDAPLPALAKELLSILLAHEDSRVLLMSDLYKVCCEYLPIVCTESRSSAAVDSFAALFVSIRDMANTHDSVDWPTKRLSADTVLNTLKQVGQTLIDTDGPHVRALSTYYKLDGSVLEAGQFVSDQPAPKQPSTISPFSVYSKSSYQTPAQKIANEQRRSLGDLIMPKKNIKERKNGTWTVASSMNTRYNITVTGMTQSNTYEAVLEFEQPVLLLNLSVYFRYSYSSATGRLTVKGSTSVSTNSGFSLLDTKKGTAHTMLVDNALISTSSQINIRPELGVHHADNVNRTVRYLYIRFKADKYISGSATIGIVPRGVRNVTSMSDHKGLCLRTEEAEKDSVEKYEDYVEARDSLRRALDELHISMHNSTSTSNREAIAEKERMHIASLYRTLSKAKSAYNTQVSYTRRLREWAKLPSKTEADMSVRLCRARYATDVLLGKVVREDQFNEKLLVPETAREYVDTLFVAFVIHGDTKLRNRVSQLLAALMCAGNDATLDLPAVLLSRYMASDSFIIAHLNYREVLESITKLITGSISRRLSQIDCLLQLIQSQAGNQVSDERLTSWLLLMLDKALNHPVFANKAVHFGCKCAHCGIQPIYGARFRSVTRRNYDLCADCESRDEHAAKRDVFIQIDKPLPLIPQTVLSESEREHGMPALLPDLCYPTDAEEAQKKMDEQIELAQKDPQAAANPPSTPPHGNCSDCNKLISSTNVCYKCINCDEYSLCSPCYAKRKHFKHHLFLKLRRPIPALTFLNISAHKKSINAGADGSGILLPQGAVMLPDGSAAAAAVAGDAKPPSVVATTTTKTLDLEEGANDVNDVDLQADNLEAVELSQAILNSLSSDTLKTPTSNTITKVEEAAEEKKKTVVTAVSEGKKEEKGEAAATEAKPAAAAKKDGQSKDDEAIAKALMKEEEEGADANATTSNEKAVLEASLDEDDTFASFSQLFDVVNAPDLPSVALPKALVHVVLPRALYPHSALLAAAERAAYLKAQKKGKKGSDDEVDSMKRALNLNEASKSVREAVKSGRRALSRSVGAPVDSDDEDDNDAEGVARSTSDLPGSRIGGPFTGAPLQALFSQLSIFAAQTNSLLIVPASRVMIGLLPHYTDARVCHEVLEHARFTRFLHDVANNTSPFVHGVVLDLIEKLVDEKTYHNNPQPEAATSIPARMFELVRDAVTNRLTECISAGADSSSKAEGSGIPASAGAVAASSTRSSAAGERALYCAFLLDILRMVTSRPVLRHQMAAAAIRAALSSSAGKKARRKNKKSSAANTVVDRSWRHASTPGFREIARARDQALKEFFPIPDALARRLISLFEEIAPVSPAAGRCWSSTFSLLEQANPHLVLRQSAFFAAISRALSAPPMLQGLLRGSCAALVRHLCALGDGEADGAVQLREHIFELLLTADAEDNALYEEFVECSRDSIVSPATLSSLLSAVASDLPNLKYSRTLAVFSGSTRNTNVSEAPSQESSARAGLLTLVLDLCTKCPAALSQLISPTKKAIAVDMNDDDRPSAAAAVKSAAASGKQLSITSFLMRVMRWLGEWDRFAERLRASNAYNPFEELREKVVDIMQAVSEKEEGAKLVARCAAERFAESPAQGLLALLSGLFEKHQDLRKYLVAELQAHKAVFEQLRLISLRNEREDKNSSEVINVLLPSKLKYSRELSHEILEGNQYENFTSLCVPIGRAVASSLRTVLRSSDASQSSVSTTTPHLIRWQLPTAADPAVITVELPTDALLREVMLGMTENYSSGGTRSQYPEWVEVEAGASLNRLVQCGRFNCPTNPNNYSSTYTSVFRFAINLHTPIRYVRIHLKRPRGERWCKLLAIKKLAFLGYSMRQMCNPRATGAAVRLLNADVAVLWLRDLLSNAESCAFVSQQFGRDPANSPLAYLLRFMSDGDAGAAASEVALRLCRNSESLTDFVLDQCMANPGPRQASLVGYVCSLPGERAAKRVEALRQTVFEKLSSPSIVLVTNENRESVEELLLATIPLVRAFVRALRAHSDLSDQQVSEESIKLLLAAVNAASANSGAEEALMTLLVALSASDATLFGRVAVLGEEKGALRVLTHLACSSDACSTCMLESDQLKSLMTRFNTVADTLLKEVEASADKKKKVADITPEASSELLELSELLGTLAHDRALKDFLGQHVVQKALRLCGEITNLSPECCVSLVQLLCHVSNLHEANQKAIAEYLSKLVHDQVSSGKSDLSSTVQVLLEKLFDAQDTVGVCLISRSGQTVDLLQSGAGESEPPLVFDQDKLGPGLEAEGGTLIGSASKPKTWSTALIGGEPMTSGVHCWEVHVEQVATTFMCGFATAGVRLNTHVGTLTSGQKCMAYYSCAPSYLYMNGQSSTYGERLNAGDILTIELDLNTPSLRLFKNGNELAELPARAANSFKTCVGEAFYPAVSLLAPGDRIRISRVSNSSSSSSGSVSTSKSLLAPAPLRFQRPDPVFRLARNMPLCQFTPKLLRTPSPSAKTITRLSLYLNPNDDGAEELGAEATLSSLMAADSGLAERLRKNELLDLYYEVDEMSKEGYNYLLAHQEEILKDSASTGSSGNMIFSSFAQGSGMSDLVEWMLRKHASGDESQLDDSRLLTLKWMRRLSSQLRLPGYTDKFASNPECRALLSRMIRGESMVPARMSLVEARHMLLNPLDEALHDLFRSATSSEIRTQSVRAGVVHCMMRAIADVATVPHRNPATFADRVTEIEQRRKEAERKKKLDMGQKYWASGTGYGTNSDKSTGWSQDAYMKEQQLKAEQTTTLLKGLVALLSTPKEDAKSGKSEAAAPPASGAEEKKDGNNKEQDLRQVLEDSCLLPLLDAHLRNDSVLDMVKFKGLYVMIMKLVQTMTLHRELWPLLDRLESNSTSVADLMQKLGSVSQDMVENAEKLAKLESKSKAATPTLGKDDEKSAKEELELARLISEVSQSVKKTVEQLRVESKSAAEEAASAAEAEASKSEFQRYAEALGPEQFAEHAMSSADGKYKHHYASQIASSTGTNRRKLRRLMREISSLKHNLPLHLSSSVFLRVDEDRPDVMQALITGPEKTPYQGGCFLFDIFCGNTYPKAPPVVNLETTGNASVRFNPNLYNSGKVCLSLLGTWSAATNEKWNEKTSTLLQVLVSIQSLIFVEQPYFNEPGYERQMNTASGKSASRAYNDRIRVSAIQWAMVDMLRNPPAGFENVIAKHFELRRDAILAEIMHWEEEARTSKTSGHSAALRTQMNAFKAELKKRYGDIAPKPSVGLASKKSTTGGKNKSLHEFDSTATSSALVTMTNSNKTVEFKGSNKWCTVMTPGSFTKGTVSWKIKVDKSLKGTMMVGVCGAKTTSSGYLGGTSDSWAYLGISGSSWHAGHKKPYIRASFKQGDIVECIVNRSAKTVSFAVNGVSRGVAYSKIVENSPLRFGVSFYHTGDKITIQN